MGVTAPTAPEPITPRPIVVIGAGAIVRIAGSTTAGTMTASPQIGGYYTAPAAMPMSGDTFTVTAACQADPTKTASTRVILTQ